ncbi:MAG: IPT/TIG domain-containing protein [Bacteriovoracaceae bacterium]
MKYLMLSSLVLLSSCMENPFGQKSKAGGSFAPGLGAPPRISSISPTQGPYNGGTNITIEGSGFTSSTIVKVGGVACSSVTFTSSTQLICLTPEHAMGLADVYVQNSDLQSSTLTNAFDFITSAAGTPGYAILSAGQARGAGTTISSDSSIGEPFSGNVMTSTTMQLRVGVQGIMFDPNL